MATDALPWPFDELEPLLSAQPPGVEAQVACEVPSGGRAWPVPVFTLGSADPTLPALGVFGGVHGLERIGCEVALAFLRSLLQRLPWDAALQHLLQHMRVLVMPLVNPGGLLRGTRANPQGVDLMRNAPVDCAGGAPFLVGGQRISAGLPWYRGPEGAPMQPEAQALCAVVEQELMGRPFALALDCHSGFGLHDRLWFPHAHTAVPVEHLPELQALSTLLDEALLHHRYVFEPQSRQYLAHGDLWDHLYLRALGGAGGAGGVLLPLTLEMGSWLWVKKNPRQMFSRHGIFNPLIEHRQQRVLRRHLALLDFALRAACSHQRWRPAPTRREALREQALDRWYRGP
ncbi:MAG: zinc carboxypeptidase [Burkholderiales bacterium]|nr:zinc carboxypeptidase [Burkholderiales bacterium]